MRITKLKKVVYLCLTRLVDMRHISFWKREPSIKILHMFGINHRSIQLPMKFNVIFILSSQIKRRKIEAFSYNWRLWTLPEIQECLREAGFRHVDVYMQGWDDKKNEETEQFYKVKKCDADPAWVAYLVAKNRLITALLNL